jgi:hypothetical protein
MGAGPLMDLGTNSDKCVVADAVAGRRESSRERATRADDRV